ncbi:MAG: SET domain-containing protein-lysine N-methyltransferase [Chlamydiota bacterium]
MEALFKAGNWKLNRRNAEGHTLLHLAAIEHRPSAMQKLLALNADQKSKSRFGMTAADYARLLGHIDCLFECKQLRQSPLLIYRNADRKLHEVSPQELGQKLNFDYLDHLIFDRVCDLEWAAKKSHACLKRKNFRKMNRWICALHEEQLMRPRVDHIYLRWIDAYLGYGIFAAKDLPALTYIGEYTGIVTVRTRKKARHNDYIFGYMIGPYNSPFIIDAKKRGNLTRFINHSIEPNIISRWIVTGGITHIAFFSKQFIPKGGQLTYDYGNYYWKKRSDPMVI